MSHLPSAIRIVRFLVSAFGLLLLAACQLIPQSAPTLAPLPTALPASPVPPTPPGSPTPVPSPIIVTREIKETGQNPVFTLKLAYPYLDDSQEARYKLFNSQVEQLVAELQSGFKKDIAGLPANPDGNTTGSYLDTTYKITSGEGGMVSILFTNGFYMSGAAHPNSYFISLNLDLANQKILTLSDLMSPGADYLGVISTYCKQELQKMAATDYEIGAAPKAENFKSWNITPSGLQIAFDPYQVAPYAMGPLYVTIPYSDLKAVLNPQGPLAKMLN